MEHQVKTEYVNETEDGLSQSWNYLQKEVESSIQLGAIHNYQCFKIWTFFPNFLETGGQST